MKSLQHRELRMAIMASERRAKSKKNVREAEKFTHAHSAQPSFNGRSFHVLSTAVVTPCPFQTPESCEMSHSTADLPMRLQSDGQTFTTSVPQEFEGPSVDTPKGIVDLPTELIGEIASYLDPSSFIAFSHTSLFRKQLSTTSPLHGSNFLWYKALPPALLNRSARFQKLRLPWEPKNRCFQADISNLLPAKILGAPYEPRFNYKLEILGRWRSPHHCHVCLSSKDENGDAIKLAAWGRKWCGLCYAENTIRHSDIAIDAAIITCLFQYEGKKYGSGKTAVYHRPSIEAFIEASTGKTLFQWLQVKRSGEVIKLKDSIKSKALTTKRRELRIKIVQMAKRYWQWEQFSQKKTDEVPNPIQPPGPQLKNILAKYSFAPTSKLESFLFPPWLLSEDYSSAAAMLDYKWLKDPTAHLNGITLDRKLKDKQWIRQTAMVMVTQLCDFFSNVYTDKGNGGSVTTWINAANEWHTARINNELADGSITRFEHITLGDRYKDDGPQRGITDLRERLGLPGDPLRHADPGISDSWSYDKKEQAANKHFHRIASQSCRRCPVSSLFFFPCGLESMLEHLRIDHPCAFWCGDFHSLA